MKLVDDPRQAAVLATLQKWAERHPEVSKVIIFGSRIHGAPRPDSDIDIAVELDKSQWDESPFGIWIASAQAWRQELELLLPWELDLQWHDRDGETGTVAAGILSGHIIAYERCLK